MTAQLLKQQRRTKLEILCMTLKTLKSQLKHTAARSGYNFMLIWDTSTKLIIYQSQKQHLHRLHLLNFDATG